MSFQIRKDNTEALKKEARKVAKKKLTEFAQVMVEQAKDRTPVRFGHNKDSITFRWEGSERVRVLTESGYGAYLELGTSKMAARPYMRPAFEFAKKELESVPWE